MASELHDWVRGVSVVDLFVLLMKALVATVLAALSIGVPIGIIAAVLSR